MSIGRLIKRCLRVPQVLFADAFSRWDPTAYARWIGVSMGPGTRIYGRVNWGTEPFLIELGANVHITQECVFVTHDGATLILRQTVPDLEITAPIHVGNDVYVGVRSILLPGVRIGNRVIVGAGAVVTRDIPDNSVAVGVPARVIGSVDGYLRKAQGRSLHLGHLTGRAKVLELRRLFRL